MRQATAIDRIFPTLLARSLAASVLLSTVEVLALLLGLFTVIDFVELRSLGAPTGILFASYGLKIPSIVVLLLPPAAAVSIALHTAALRRTGEWDAMHSLGISHLSTLLRLLAVPVFFGGLSFALSAWGAPPAAARFEAALRSHEQSSSTTCEGRWTRQSVGYARFDCDGRPDIVIETNDRGVPVGRFDRVSPSGRDWEAFPPSASSIEEIRRAMTRFARPVPLPSTNLLAGQSMTLGALAQSIGEAERAGLSAGPLRAERALRIAVAAACVAVPALLLALLLLFPTENAWRSAAAAVLIIAIYWVVAAVVWTSVSVGLCSELTLSIGVPSVFSLLAGVVFCCSSFTPKRRFVQIRA